ncbi:MAG: glycosyltransferase family 2 protein [Bacteroidota bacterium]
MSLAPIIVFAYNRPDLLQRTLDSLGQNELISSSEVFIYCDGAKTGASESDRSRLEATAAVARSFSGPAAVTVTVRETNMGLATSVITGITEIINRFGRAIIIEDDVLLSRYFLRFMNDALTVYENEPKVKSIGSWVYYKDKFPYSYFLRVPDTIAWATWKKDWEEFEKDPVVLKTELANRNLTDRFNLDGNLDQMRMLNDQIAGRVNSWAIRWAANFILNDKYCFYPKQALAKHIGFAKGATHTQTMDYNKNLVVSQSQIRVERMEPKEDEAALATLVKFNRSLNRLHKKLLNLILSKF